MNGENNVEKKVEIEKKNTKEQFEEILKKIKKMSEAIELHDDVKKAVEKEEVDYNYLRYIENSLEEKIFGSANVKEIMPKILLEVICEELKNIENFEPQKLQIENIGSHFENGENYIDKICIYDNDLVSVFGINELHPNKVIKYDARKFSRADMIEAISAKYEEGRKIKLYQFDEYYVAVEEERIKVYSERKITALVKIEETIFDKIKLKLSNIFIKKKSYPNLELVYDSNPNRLNNFENKSKFAAKNRMKALLNCEREITRV